MTPFEIRRLALSLAVELPAATRHPQSIADAARDFEKYLTGDVFEPTAGVVVHYTLNAQDAEAIEGSNDRSNPHREGDVLPMLVTRVYSVGVNGQVFLDGYRPPLWVTSRPEGEGPGTWAWPTR